MKRKFYGFVFCLTLLSTGLAAQFTRSNDILDGPETGSIHQEDTISIAQFDGLMRVTIPTSDFSKVPYSWTFVSSEETMGWSIGADTEWAIGGRLDNEYGYFRVKEDGITSPLVDLSEFNTPVIFTGDNKYEFLWETTSGNGPYYYVSIDGEHWVKGYGCIIPKWTKYLRLHKINLKSVFIADVANDVEWQLVDSYSAKPSTMLSIDINRDGKLDGIKIIGILHIFLNLQVSVMPLII